MARCIWMKGSSYGYDLTNLQHLHLHSCPSLEYALPVCTVDNSFPSLKTLYIIRCGDLMHVLCKATRRILQAASSPKADHDPPVRPAVAAADMRGRRDTGARLGNPRNRGRRELASAASLEGPRAGHEEAHSGDREGRVGRSGVGRGGIGAPPFPLRGARAVAVLQEVHAQGHSSQVKIVLNYASAAAVGYVIRFGGVFPSKMKTRFSVLV
uniref:Uncharacterized protein n=1 Tax=Aegilops tauschii TaxID=37682 RepID=R7W1A1_AEGTA